MNTSKKSPEPKYTFLQPTMKGWDRVWAVIAAKYGNGTCEDPSSHEVWQYMQTVDGKEHQIRHRNLNGGGKVYEIVPAASDDFEPK